MTTFLLFESASGYGLFELTAADELGGVDAVQQSVNDIQRFGKSIKLAAFKPFTSAANALEQINAVSESQVGMHMPDRPLQRPSASRTGRRHSPGRQGRCMRRHGAMAAAATARRPVAARRQPCTLLLTLMRPSLAFCNR